MAKKGSIEEFRKKVTTTHDFISTSYHEAGHVIYALLHMMCVSSVTVFEDKKLKRIHGVTYYNYPIEFDKVEDPELLIILAKADVGISYSGLIAEKALFKSISGAKSIPIFISDGSREDNKSASDVIKKYNLAPPGPKRYLYKQKIIRKSQQEIYKHWDAVTVVAHGLFRHRRLSFNDLKNLLTKRTHNKVFWKEQFKKISYFYDERTQLDENDLKIILSS